MSEKRVSKSISFGMSNFFFCNSYTGSNVTGDDNEYIIFMDNKGLILIARYNSDGNEGRYCVKAGEYDTVVAGRGGYNYVLPAQLKEIMSESIK